MPMSIDGLYTKIIVRRVGVGITPFTWEVADANVGNPIFVSSDRFRSMDAAYRAGQSRLNEFLPKKARNHGKRAKAVVGRASASDIDWYPHQVDQFGVDGGPESDGAPNQDGQPYSVMLDDRAA